MKKLNLTTIFDWIVIILEICYGISMLMHVFYLVPAIGMLLPLTSLMVICQLVRFGTKVRIINFAFKNPIVSIFFFIYRYIYS